jgi:cell division septation protein DedD
VSRPRPAAPSRIGTVFFALGCLSVLGTAFASGMYAGRAWPSFLSWVAPRAARVEVARGKDAHPEKRPAPVLTFYEELAAPLGPSPAPAPRPKVQKPAPRPAADGVTASAAAGSPPPAAAPAGTAAAPSPAATPPAARPAPSPETESASSQPPRNGSASASSVAPARGPRDEAEASGRYTVQVGAFNARGPADALRARLSAAGLDAYVTTIEVAGGARYRVRVGSYTSREEARQAAVRLASERQVSTTYVTAR